MLSACRCSHIRKAVSRGAGYMKRNLILLTFACMLAATGSSAQAQSSGSEDYPLLSQGSITPPPPPPGYSFALPAMEPSMAPPPPPTQAELNKPFVPPVNEQTPPDASSPAPETVSVAPTIPMASESVTPPVQSPPAAVGTLPFAAPPVLPSSQVQPAPAAPDMTGSTDVPDSARFKQEFITRPVAGPKAVQLITPKLANEVKRLLRSLKTMRTIIDTPESGDDLRRIQLTGRVCADLFQFKGFPAPSRFAASSNDLVLRDRSHDAAEYRHYGDFDNRVNGWIKPIETAVYLDLVFDGRSRRRTHIRAQFTRTGPFTGSFYAYSWDAYGNPWKMQGSLENLFVHDDGLPAGGILKVYGADPAGKAMGLALQFPVKVLGESSPEKGDTRHRTGQRVSIGN